MSMGRFIDDLRQTRRLGTWKRTGNGAIRLVLGPNTNAAGKECCPITAVQFHRTGELVSTGETGKTAVVRGPDGIGADQEQEVIHAADNSGWNPLRTQMLRAVGL